jgi:predicted ATPase
MTPNQIIQTLIKADQIPNCVDLNLLLSDNPRQFPTMPITQSFHIQGGNGIGKTYFTTLFLRDWMVNEFPDGFENYMYKNLPNFVKMDSLERYVRDRNGFDQDAKYGVKLALDEIKNTKLLIVDDFWISDGTPNFKQQMLSELFKIFDYRWQNNLQTIITTNIDLKKIDTIDKNFGRIVSRIQAFPELELPNKIDRRFQPKIGTNKQEELPKPEKLSFSEI